MKKLIKLVLFFSISFAVLMVVSTGLRFLAVRIDGIRFMPQQEGVSANEFLSAAYWALSLSFFGSVLLGLSYAVRKKILTLTAVLCVGLLSLVFVYAFTLGLKSLRVVPSAAVSTEALGGPGLIIYNPALIDGTAVVLLEPSNPNGSRVISVPGQPLVHMTEFPGSGSVGLSFPLFRDGSPWFLRSIVMDIRLFSENLRRQFAYGPLFFLLYAGALVVFMTSCIFILKLSAWPLANLFLGALAFRGILSLEVFFSSPEMLDVFNSFLQNRLPGFFAVPLIFFSAGILMYLYLFLVFLVKRRSDYAD